MAATPGQFDERQKTDIFVYLSVLGGYAKVYSAYK